MRVSVVIPTTRPVVATLLASLDRQTRPADEILVISNEVEHPGVVRFSSEIQPIGIGDAGLRRNIGADLATGDLLLFLDDDEVAPRTMIEDAIKVVEAEQFCWGHHRFIDFAAHPLDELIDLPPTAGRSRETYVNGWHGWQSSYAGMFAITRSLFWQVGGFDLAFLGHHGSEDQQLGNRLSGDKHRTYVHEPPFAWHPTEIPDREWPQEDHVFSEQTISGHRFSVCETCPRRIPLDLDALAMSATVVIPYQREQFTLRKES